jgi:hypothetical protein
LNPVWFLRLLLLVPLLAPVVAYPFASLGLNFLLTMSLASGGLAYLVCAIAAWRMFGRCSSNRDAVVAMLQVPLLFGAVMCLVWFVKLLAWGGQPAFGWMRHVVGHALAAGSMALIGLILGYVYVAVWVVVFGLCRRLGWVRGFSAVATVPDASTLPTRT